MWSSLLNEKDLQALLKCCLAAVMTCVVRWLAQTARQRQTGGERTNHGRQRGEGLGGDLGY